MTKRDQKDQGRRADERLRKNLPPGVKLVRTLRGHTGWIGRIAWSPDGLMLASPSADRTVRLWNAETGECLHALYGHEGDVNVVAFDPTGRKLASGSIDRVIRIWDPALGNPLNKLHAGHWVDGVAFVGASNMLATASGDGIVQIWDIANDRRKVVLTHQQAIGNTISFDPLSGTIASVGQDNSLHFYNIASNGINRFAIGHSDSISFISSHAPGGRVATASADGTVKVWNARTAQLDLSLEGHTGEVNCVDWSADGDLLASKSKDCSVRLWRGDTGLCIAVIAELTLPDYYWPPGLAFHPRLPFLASVGTDTADRPDQVVRIWELECGALLGKSAAPTVTYTSAKVVLVGDSGVGKTGLGWRLAHGEFKEQSSTHGQQFWVLPELGFKRKDGTHCEAVLWDLAGQHVYRQVHSIFLDNVAAALVLFDPTNRLEPLKGVQFWLEQLKGKGQMAPVVLIGARADRGGPALSQQELDQFCQRYGIRGGHLSVSAKSGEGLDTLLKTLKAQIPWEEMTATVTTVTFKRIEDHVLALKEKLDPEGVLVSPLALREKLQASDRDLRFTDAEMITAVRHLETHGYVAVLGSSAGEECILLAPNLLVSLASSIVLLADRHPRGLGAVSETELADRNRFSELAGLSPTASQILLDAAILRFLQHNICFRETSGNETLLIFPSLIKQKRPLHDDFPSTEDIFYVVRGRVENLYASLVVLLGYTPSFTRINQWQNQAQYEMSAGEIC
jgi:small GTP-binding protein